MRYVLALIVVLAWQFGPVFHAKPLPPLQTAAPAVAVVPATPVAAAPIDFDNLHAQAKEALERLKRAQDHRMRLASNERR